ncbi:HAMP domain-containing sensor histidine kinase [Actinoplanes sp. N902-109]|uniref:HAMP domain-containing sensor histidine kinase n=1 Tax=Actinoplanes sp. (strain N902-109) TaxID=649831 RepID=UPI00032935AC|nr:HAMP domain-containing sensor histidine kinase [Actinoplanes sp. N902-109]AGL16757.1 integral membrane sensor signal transduction histidine kinase [Actinoplanes sp. N902-109]
MSPHSPARRIFLVCALLLIAGSAAHPAADRLLRVWTEVGPSWCTVPAGRAPQDPSFVCAQLFRRPSIPSLLSLAVVLLILFGASWFLVRWCVRPVRELAPAIADVGPQNLGHRLRPGPGRDALAVLGRAIDEMMDRIAVGYEAQRRFAADASHELRTPLAVQRMLIEVGMARTLSDDQLALLTAQLLETNERNERLIEGLLVLSESDRGLLARTPLRLDHIVAAVLDKHESAAAEAGITITRRLRPRTVLGEQVLLERLAGNLIQNALKYNRPDGTIDVQVGDDPALAVTNTGDDIPPQDVPALFEPFRRRTAARIDHSGGAGLGLAIARSITRAHHGIIAASSTGHDGLHVQVSLPPADAPGTVS